MRDLSDDALLAFAQEGNEGAFEELMKRNCSSSFKLALSILKDRQDAEDEVQNSYWNAWRHIGQFHRDAKFSTWISRIVINHCLMRLRKARRATFLYLDDGGAEGDMRAIELRDLEPTPEADVSNQEISTILRTEIRKLPPLLRCVLELRDLHELPIEEVAGQLGITIAAAKSRLMRARHELKRRVDRQLRPSGRSAVPA
jgi:RNA polymerase sigma-70 factor (ECF subfamily)